MALLTFTSSVPSVPFGFFAAAIIGAYLMGSIPFGLWVSYLVAGVDIREGGSGHISTTNTMRHAGWAAGVLVLVLDMAKGFAPTYFALKLGLPGWGIALTATLAVIGHCWPVFAKFKGGMGLATTGGALLAVSPLGMAIGLGVLVALVLLYGHSARGSAMTRPRNSPNAVAARPARRYPLGGCDNRLGLGYSLLHRRLEQRV